MDLKDLPQEEEVSTKDEIKHFICVKSLSTRLIRLCATGSEEFNKKIEFATQVDCALCMEFYWSRYCANCHTYCWEGLAS